MKYLRAVAALMALLALEAQTPVENTVVFYSSLSIGDVNTMVQQFEATNPIKVQVLRMESAQVPTRLQIEQRAGHFEADVESDPSFQTAQIKSAGLLERFRPPETSGYLPGTFDPDGYWTGAFINADTIIYNVDGLKAAGLKAPTSWNDLTRPEWRGKFALYKFSYEWYSAMKRSLGAAAADRLMRGLAANAPALLDSHQLAIDQTAAGEYVAGASVYSYQVARLKAAGRPVEFVNAPPTVAEMNELGLVKNAPHPQAARTFIRWWTSREGQSFMVKRLGRASPRKDVQDDPTTWNSKMRIVISSPAQAANFSPDVAAYNEIFGITQ